MKFNFFKTLLMTFSILLVILSVLIQNKYNSKEIDLNKSKSTLILKFIEQINKSVSAKVDKLNEIAQSNEKFRKSPLFVSLKSKFKADGEIEKSRIKTPSFVDQEGEAFVFPKDIFLYTNTAFRERAYFGWFLDTAQILYKSRELNNNSFLYRNSKFSSFETFIFEVLDEIDTYEEEVFKRVFSKKIYTFLDNLNIQSLKVVQNEYLQEDLNCSEPEEIDGQLFTCMQPYDNSIYIDQIKANKICSFNENFGFSLLKDKIWFEEGCYGELVVTKELRGGFLSHSIAEDQKSLGFNYQDYPSVEERALGRKISSFISYSNEDFKIDKTKVKNFVESTGFNFDIFDQIKASPLLLLHVNKRIEIQGREEEVIESLGLIQDKKIHDLLEFILRKTSSFDEFRSNIFYYTNIDESTIDHSVFMKDLLHLGLSSVSLDAITINNLKNFSNTLNDFNKKTECFSHIWNEECNYSKLLNQVKLLDSLVLKIAAQNNINLYYKKGVFPHYLSPLSFENKGGVNNFAIWEYFE